MSIARSRIVVMSPPTSHAKARLLKLSMVSTSLLFAQERTTKKSVPDVPCYNQHEELQSRVCMGIGRGNLLTQLCDDSHRQIEQVCSCHEGSKQEPDAGHHADREYESD